MEGDDYHQCVACEGWVLLSIFNTSGCPNCGTGLFNDMVMRRVEVMLDRGMKIPFEQLISDLEYKDLSTTFPWPDEISEEERTRHKMVELILGHPEDWLIRSSE
jgi:predicted  nucleic acid-binding Zn-ribbon protein